MFYIVADVNRKYNKLHAWPKKLFRGKDCAWDPIYLDPDPDTDTDFTANIY